MSGKIYIELKITGEQLKATQIELDDDTVRMLVIHWREREYARIAEATNPTAAMWLQDRINRRREFMGHLGSLITQRLVALIETIEDKH